MTHEPARPPAPAENPGRKPRRKPRQCNADYRWTVPKVTAFLEALAQSGRVADAARAVGMSRQSAYALRARLDGAKFRAAFEGARKAGIRARAAASLRRSQWEGPGLAALDHLRASQGDTATMQADTAGAQVDASPAQADAFPRKPTENLLERVTPVTRLAPAAGEAPPLPRRGPRAR